MAERKLISTAGIVLKAIIVLLGLYYILCYLFMVSKRLFYPFELEWLEGYFVSAMIRIVNSKPLYTAPNQEFVPFLYPPVYYWITGNMAKIFGPGFQVARIVSVLSSFISGSVIFKFISRETGNRLMAFVGVSMFFACYGLSDFWYDVARVDSLFLAFTLSGLYILRYYSCSTSGVAVAALILSLAYFTKQPALFFIILCSFYLWHIKKSRFMIFITISFLFVVGGNLLLNWLTDGWYWFYSFTVPMKHYGYTETANNPVLGQIYSYYTHFAQQNYGSIKKLYYFFADDLLGNIPFILSLIIAWFLHQIKSPEKNGSVLFPALAFMAALLASITMRCKFGGHINGIIPAVSVAIIFFCIIAGYLIKEFTGNSIIVFFLYVSILFQFIMLKYNPLNHIPGPGDYKAGKQLIETVSSFRGDVYMPFHSYYPVMAGKKMYAHRMPVDDVFIGFKDKLPGRLLDKISKRQFSAIIHDWAISPDTENPVEKTIISHYEKTSEIHYENPDTFMPLTGFRVRPQFVYVPKEG